MVGHQDMQTRAGLFRILEGLVGAIRAQGGDVFVARGGIVIQACSLARQLIEDAEMEKLQKQVEAMKVEYMEEEAAASRIDGRIREKEAAEC